MSEEVYPKFTSSLLHPRYWLVWLGLGLLRLMVMLPYSMIVPLGKTLGRFSMRFLKRRVHIADRNLQLCFPDLSDLERRARVIENFESTGMALFETGMAWFWSDKRIKKLFRVEGLENLQKPVDEKKGILLIGIHFLNLELGARMIGLFNPGVGVYRPHDNAVMDYVQKIGRLKSNKFMLDRKDIRGMARALKQGEMVWYAPDHDYGPKSSTFAPFFAVENAASTIGTSILVRLSRPTILPFMLKRESGDSGYTLFIESPLEDFPLEDETAAATYINQAIEKEILRAPGQYMWLHRRFKTRPAGEPSLYD